MAGKRWTNDDLVRKGLEVTSSIGKEPIKSKKDSKKKSEIKELSSSKLENGVVRLNIKPLTTNRAWKGRRFPTDLYNEYKADMDSILPEIFIPDPPYQIEYTVAYSNVQSDIDNFLKQAQDCIAKKYKFNDRLIYKLIITKVIVPVGKEYIEFNITTIE